MDRELTANERTNILLEDMRSEFRAVTECVVQVRDDVGELKKNLEKTNGKVDYMSLRLLAVEHQVKDLKHELKEFKNEFNDFREEVKNEFTDVRGEIHDFRNDVNMNHDAMRHILSDHEHRLTKLEAV